jgi:hypothetical protein
MVGSNYNETFINIVENGGAGNISVAVTYGTTLVSSCEYSN